MTLDDWLRTQGITDAEFARRSGVRHKQLVGKYRKRRQIPGLANMRRIHEATDGAVSANDFFMPAAKSDPVPTEAAVDARAP